MRPSGSPQEFEQRRVRALRLLGEGFAPVEVARQIGVDLRCVRRWKAAAARDLTRLRHRLLKGALTVGLPTGLWSCPRVSCLIERQFGVHYHPARQSTPARLRLFTERPTRRLERDEERIRAWIGQDWPRVCAGHTPVIASAGCLQKRYPPSGHSRGSCRKARNSPRAQVVSPGRQRKRRPSWSRRGLLVDFLRRIAARPRELVEDKLLILMVGVTGFEPATPTSRT
jgi:transposase